MVTYIEPLTEVLVVPEDRAFLVRVSHVRFLNRVYLKIEYFSSSAEWSSIWAEGSTIRPYLTGYFNGQPAANNTQRFPEGSYYLDHEGLQFLGRTNRLEQDVT